MDDLITKRLPLIILKPFNSVEVRGILRDKGATLEHIGDVRQVMLLGEFFDVLKQTLTRNASERVLDPSRSIRQAASYSLGNMATYLADKFELRFTWSCS